MGNIRVKSLEKEEHSLQNRSIGIEDTHNGSWTQSYMLA